MKQQNEIEKPKVHSPFTYFLIGLLVMGLLWIAYTNITSAWESKQNSLILQGQTEGYQTAIYMIAQESTKCQPIPIMISANQTIHLIATECLQGSVK